MMNSVPRPVADASRFRIDSLGIEGLRELFAGGLQVFRQDPCFRDRRHKIYVALPAGKHVHVDVSCYSGSGRGSDVHSDVQAGGFVDLAQMNFG